MRFAAFLFAVVMVVSSAFAVVPTTMTYQAIFTDLEGNVMPDGVYEIGFHIFSSAIGGPPVWSEWQDVTVTDGVFEVTLGTIFALDPSDFLDPEGDGLWMSLEYNDTWMHPRQFISSVPFAFISCWADSARTAGSLGGYTVEVVDSLVQVFDDRLDDAEACLDTVKSQIDSVRAGLIGEGAGFALNSNRSTDDPENGIELEMNELVDIGVPVSVNLDVPSAMVITAAARKEQDFEICDASEFVCRIEVETQDEGEVVYASLDLTMSAGSDIMISAITPQLDPDDYLVILYVRALGGDCSIVEYEVAVSYQGPLQQPIMQSSRSQAQPRR